MSQNQGMGFPGGGGVKGLIVGANRTARLWLASILIAVCAVGALYRALQEPSLGWRFMAGPNAQVLAQPVGSSPAGHAQAALQGVTALSAVGVSVAITPTLLIESAGIHNEYAVHNHFFAEHRRLWEIVRSPQVSIHHAQGVTNIAPHARGIDELGMRFWFPWLVGLLSLSVGLAIWVYQPLSSASWCYAIASAGYAFGMLCTSTWGSRLLTQPPQAWPELHVASHFASFMVQCGLCVLLWLHPRRLGGNWLIWVLVAVALLSTAADGFQWLPTISLAFRLPIVLVAALLGVLFVLQWRACRTDASQRAQLKWFGLLLFMGLSTVFVAYAFGAAGHVVNLPQNYGLGTVALIFLGLVPLVTRVGLFKLEAWWPRAWLWFLGGLLVIAMDLALVVMLDLGADSAFALALALAGWLYFPVRQLLWRRLSQGALPGTRDVLPQILEVVTHGQGDSVALNLRWRQLWDTLFQPARMTVAPEGTTSGIAQEGRRLVVAACGPLDALEMELPERGGRLFNPADFRRANEIHDLVQQGLASGEAFDRGARQERQRIASDLHDDLGAKLLTIAQASGSERVAVLAREALDEMRLSVRGLTGQVALASDVFADWRAEAVTRLAAAGVEPQWTADEPPLGMALPARAQMQLTRVLREAVSNVIRHSGAKTCRVRIAVSAVRLELEVSDDGHGIEANEGGSRGNGLPGIERRARLLGGVLVVEPASLGGLCVRVEIPVAATALPGDGWTGWSATEVKR
ncbi:sensor histidine kinase [Caenimonas sp. SL110]|uniref:sensor histidine kinase n=1 Tax=Caenimonas sp. SL110 TaxID=1450524 RepID=UPI00128B2DFE|nr:ATP-binding protein [Caenimonas sp. SL110]